MSRPGPPEGRKVSSSLLKPGALDLKDSTWMVCWMGLDACLRLPGGWPGRKRAALGSNYSPLNHGSKVDVY